MSNRRRTTYTVGTAECGTTSSLVKVEVIAAPNAGVDAELEICINNGPVDLLALLGANAGKGGSWRPSLKSGGGLFDPAIDAKGNYTYTVGTEFCGKTSATVNVVFLPLKPLHDYNIKVREMGKDNNIEIATPVGRTFQYALDGQPYQSENRFSNLSGGEYIVFIKETDGCGYAEQKIWIMAYPKFFSPNNDGQNDFWTLKGVNEQLYDLRIYDRYGKLLALLRKGEKWDGSFNGSPLPADDYWFEVRFEEGMTKKGNFSLLR